MDDGTTTTLWSMDPCMGCHIQCNHGWACWLDLYHRYTNIACGSQGKPTMFSYGLLLILVWSKERGWALSTADCQRHDGPENERMFYSMYMYYLLRYITFMDTVVLALRKVGYSIHYWWFQAQYIHMVFGIENNHILSLVSKHGCDPAALVVVARQKSFRKVNISAWCMIQLPLLSARLIETI